MKDEKMIVSLRSGQSAPPPAPRRERRSRAGAGIAGIAVLILLIAGGSYYLFFARSAAQAPAPAGQLSDAARVSQIVAEVGTLIELPQGEVPTVATVTDPSKLAGQTFFANAKAGDIVLLYTQARKAYLYDPAAHKLVDAAPIAATQ